MAGEMEKIFSLSGRVHVLLRRETNRIVDVEWMAVNVDYLREILRIVRATDIVELHEIAARIEELHPLLPKTAKPKISAHADQDLEREAETKYLFSLR